MSVVLHPLVSLLGADATAVHATRSFVAVMLAFVPVLAAAFSLQQLMRAEGAARQVMIGLIASTVAKLAFVVLFILVLHWGVADAALPWACQPQRLESRGRRKNRARLYCPTQPG